MITINPSLYNPRDAHRVRVFNMWFIAAITCFCAVVLLIATDVVQGAAAWILTAVTIAVLTMAVRAYIVFIRGADELLRKLHLEALALSFGAAMVFMLGYLLCEQLGAPKLNFDAPLLVMFSVFGLAIWLGAHRYSSAEAQ